MLTTILIASLYYCSSAPGEGGTRTAQGGRCDPKASAAAHRSLPFGTILNVCLARKCVAVTVNDRGPFIWGRDLDLTHEAARRLGMVARGVARVRVSAPLPKPHPAKTMMAEWQP